MAHSSREVVITGAGAACPLGIGYEAVQRALARGQSGVRRLATFDTDEFPVRVGAEVVDFDPKQYVTPRKSLKVMSRSIQLAFASAQHGHVAGRFDGRLGRSQPLRGGVRGRHDPHSARGARQRLSPLDHQWPFSIRALGRAGDWAKCIHSGCCSYLPNMPACHVAIAMDARGPNNTIVLAEASSLMAIAEGCQRHPARSGRRDDRRGNRLANPPLKLGISRTIGCIRAGTRCRLRFRDPLTPGATGWCMAKGRRHSSSSSASSPKRGERKSWPGWPDLPTRSRPAPPASRSAVTRSARSFAGACEPPTSHRVTWGTSTPTG